ncbi:hypothetical protein [Ammoniphilus sp. CFH 90114]|uniref:hypothetical protein n=1 Tax=Ammoniphilus sp. CFH 90114 TaxID=2493665 RepID=UPI00100F5D87|nr:hypothetical protein [Ammoniphilus sp. CFH 90114]RXT15342.1 hypothetical protein EIZ39_03815 [Ammoniphilus sp. CFH 90114]
MNAKLSASHLLLGAAFIIGSYFISNSIALISQREYVRLDQVSNSISNLAYEVGQLNPRNQEHHEPYLPIDPGVLTYGQTMRYLGVSGKELDHFINQTNIPYIKLDNKFLFPKEALDQWLLNLGQKTYSIN